MVVAAVLVAMCGGGVDMILVMVVCYDSGVVVGDGSGRRGYSGQWSFLMITVVMVAVFLRVVETAVHGG